MCELHGATIVCNRIPDLVTCITCGRQGPPGELTTDDPYFGDWAHEECWPEAWRRAGFPEGYPPWEAPPAPASAR